MIIDIFYIFIFILCIYIGYKRGFAKTAISFMSLFLSILAAVYFYTPFVNFINSLPGAVKITESIKSGIASAVTPFFENDTVPEIFSNFLLNSLKENAASAAAEIIFSIGLMVLFIILIKLALAIISALAGAVFKLPVLKQANSFLGGIFGALSGVAVCYVLAMVMFIVAGTSVSWFAEQIKESAITNYFLETNIFIKNISEI